jgi:hypothetical protein
LRIGSYSERLPIPWYRKSRRVRIQNQKIATALQRVSCVRLFPFLLQAIFISPISRIEKIQSTIILIYFKISTLLSIITFLQRVSLRDSRKLYQNTSERSMPKAFDPQELNVLHPSTGKAPGFLIMYCRVL